MQRKPMQGYFFALFCSFAGNVGGPTLFATIKPMNGAVLHTLGKPPRFEAFPDPTPADGEVLVHVRAAALKSVDKQMAAGTHYASPRELPVVCGADGMGRLEDGARVFFGGPRRPYGAMAERTVVRRVQCFPVPDEVDDDTAAAIPNPGVSAWLSLKHRAKLARASCPDSGRDRSHR